MAANPVEKLQKFQWEPQPAGQRLVDELLADHLAHVPASASLARAMAAKTGTRFSDWVDHVVTDRAEIAPALEAAGFTAAHESGRGSGWEHHGAIFPRIVVGERPSVALKVESVADFLATHNLSIEIAGAPFNPHRQACAWSAPGGALWVVERHGHPGIEVPATDPGLLVASQSHLESFRMRRREFDNDEHAFAEIHRLLDDAIADLGADWTADLWFAAERDYWMRRNRAARVQKARQDALGLGWANHDHHTYRCRRTTFHLVIAILERLGCACRERFYAGADAGWGAQVLEQAAAGIVIFADVDMHPSEVTGDFSHEGFSEQAELGTVGLWCELHGESMLGAGMHHLECQFDFDALREQMRAEAGIDMMKPFTDFPHLRQQFTEGERWEIEPRNIDRLLADGHITEEQARRFRLEGAIGSHLENLERNDGFKGFNQSGINEIILATDPRRAGGKSAAPTAAS